MADKGGPSFFQLDTTSCSSRENFEISLAVKLFPGLFRNFPRDPNTILLGGRQA